MGSRHISMRRMPQGTRRWGEFPLSASRPWTMGEKCRDFTPCTTLQEFVISHFPRSQLGQLDEEGNALVVKLGRAEGNGTCYFIDLQTGMFSFFGGGVLFKSSVCQNEETCVLVSNSQLKETHPISPYLEQIPSFDVGMWSKPRFQGGTCLTVTGPKNCPLVSSTSNQRIAGIVKMLCPAPRCVSLQSSPLQGIGQKVCNCIQSLCPCAALSTAYLERALVLTRFNPDVCVCVSPLRAMLY